MHTCQLMLAWRHLRFGCKQHTCFKLCLHCALVYLLLATKEIMIPRAAIITELSGLMCPKKSRLFDARRPRLSGQPRSSSPRVPLGACGVSGRRSSLATGARRPTLKILLLPLLLLPLLVPPRFQPGPGSTQVQLELEVCNFASRPAAGLSRLSGSLRVGTPSKEPDSDTQLDA